MFQWLKYDKNFQSAVRVVLNHEGGYTNNPNDPGGATDYGISLRFLRAAGIDGNGNRSGHITIDDIKALTPEKAENIYYKFYWLKYNINDINSPLLATSMLDMSVLMGNHEATLCMQRALNELEKCNLIEDGIMGMRTLAEINRANPEQLNAEFKKELLAYIDLICVKNSKLVCFKNGWINRIHSL